jgi:AraC-like DNA-binding protein
VLLFFIGFQGYLQNYTVYELKKDETLDLVSDTKSWNTEQLKNRVIDLFEKEEIYRDSDLKITHLSLRLSTNRTYISKLINNEFKVTFSDFVNQYRVEEAKILLENDTQQRYSLSYISETVGFGSLSSFIRIFKDKMGVTPGQFRENRRN